MRLARGALRLVTDRAPGGVDRRARRLARERAEESTPLVAPTPSSASVDEETARFLDADDAPATSTARAVRAGWTCVALTALTALAGATWATTMGTRGWLVSTSSVAPGRFFIRDGRASGDDANFCAATTSGIACASACDAARAPDVFEVREAEDGVGGYVTVWRRRANGEATRCATGSEDGGKAAIVCDDDDGRETTARETARERFIIASADGGRRRRRYSTSMYNQEFGGYCRDGDAEDHVVTCAFSKWSTSNARYAFVPVDDSSVAACAPLRDGESTRA